MKTIHPQTDTMISVIQCRKIRLTNHNNLLICNGLDTITREIKLQGLCQIQGESENKEKPLFKMS